MRFKVVPSLSTKDGTSNRNARLTNTLKEASTSGERAIIRPGLVVSTSYGGLGNGLIAFNRNLLTIVDDQVQFDEFTWMDLDATDWNSGTSYVAGNWVWYNGILWVSVDANSNQAPFLNSTHWRTIYEIPDWDAGTAYAIGDLVVYGGTLYYSMSPSNTGNSPSTSPQWSTSPPGSSRWMVNLKLVAALNATTPGPECASVDAAASAWFGTATTFISCATKAFGSYNWVTYVGTRYSAITSYWYVTVNQWTDRPPYDCSGEPANSGIIDGGRLVRTV